MFHNFRVVQKAGVFVVEGWYTVPGTMNWYHEIAAFEREQTAMECAQAFKGAADMRDGEKYARVFREYRLAMIDDYFDD